MSRYIDADLLQEDFKADHGGKRSLMIDTQPTADVIEIGKPYFYEEGYVLKDFHNGGGHRYFVIERAKE